MLTNNQEEQSAVDGGESVGTAGAESFVHVPNVERRDNPLTLKVTASNESVGLFSMQTTCRVVASLKACKIPGGDNNSPRAPVDVVVALDRSGSMKGEKIKGCKRTLELMVRHLGSNDRLGLVSFSGSTELEFPPMLMTKENKEKAMRKINAIEAGGGTNISGGLATAALELARTEVPNTVRSIFLLTDGHPNGGICDTSSLVDIVKSLNGTGEETNPDHILHKQAMDANFESLYPEGLSPVITNNPITLFSFGYGSDHNSHMLRAISSATPGGGYYFVEKDSNVSTAFGDAMGGLFSVVAQGVTVSISVPPEALAKGAKIVKVHHKQATKRSDTCYTVNVGDFYAEEERDVLFEVDLASAAPNNDANIADAPAVHVDVAVSFMDTIRKHPAALGPSPCRISRPASSEVSSANELVEVQWLRVQTAQAIEAANAKVSDTGDLRAARKILQAAAETITKSPAYKNDSPDSMLEDLLGDLRELIAGFQSFDCYNASGSHSAASVSLGYEMQRCVESSASKSNRFRTKAKASMSLGFL